MNSVNLIGRIATEIELKHLPDGTAVCNFTIAVDGYKDKTHFFEVVAWRKTAKNTAKYMKKGREIGISGELQQDTWETDDGQNRSKVKINARRIQFLSGEQGQSQDNIPKQDSNQEQGEKDIDVPF